MRKVENLEQGDIFVRTEFDQGSLKVQAWKVVDNEILLTRTGERVSRVLIEPLNCGLTGDQDAHFKAAERAHEKRSVAPGEMVAVLQMPEI